MGECEWVLPIETDEFTDYLLNLQDSIDLEFPNIEESDNHYRYWCYLLIDTNGIDSFDVHPVEQPGQLFKKPRIDISTGAEIKAPLAEHIPIGTITVLPRPDDQCRIRFMYNREHPELQRANVLANRVFRAIRGRYIQKYDDDYAAAQELLDQLNDEERRRG